MLAAAWGQTAIPFLHKDPLRAEFEDAFRFPISFQRKRLSLEFECWKRDVGNDGVV